MSYCDGPAVFLNTQNFVWCSLSCAAVRHLDVILTTVAASREPSVNVQCNESLHKKLIWEVRVTVAQFSTIQEFLLCETWRIYSKKWQNVRLTVHKIDRCGPEINICTNNFYRIWEVVLRQKGTPLPFPPWSVPMFLKIFASSVDAMCLY
jgi:hypothetical protein